MAHLIGERIHDVDVQVAWNGTRRTEPYQTALYSLLGDEDEWGCIFAHPDAFLPVDTSEIGEMSRLKSNFEDDLKVKMLAFVCTKPDATCTWVEDIQDATGQLVRFPIISDEDHQLAAQLRMIPVGQNQHGKIPYAVRQIVIVGPGPHRVIKATMCYPLSTGYNFHEILRLIEALQLREKSHYQITTPVNWVKQRQVFIDPTISTEDAVAGKFRNKTIQNIRTPSSVRNESRCLRLTEAPQADFAGDAPEADRLDDDYDLENSSFLLNQELPDIKSVVTTQGVGDLRELLTGNGNTWGILFCYPDDFHPTSTTEIGELQRLRPKFMEKRIQPVVLALDERTEHEIWIDDIRSVTGQMILVPVIADKSRSIAVKLRLLPKAAENSTLSAFPARSVLIVDESMRLKATICYPQAIGYNFREILRLIDALKMENHEVFTPVNWKPGVSVFVHPQLSMSDAQLKFKSINVIQVPSKDTQPKRGNSAQGFGGFEYLRITPDPNYDAPSDGFQEEKG